MVTSTGTIYHGWADSSSRDIKPHPLTSYEPLGSIGSVEGEVRARRVGIGKLRVGRLAEKSGIKASQ